MARSRETTDKPAAGKRPIESAIRFTGRLVVALALLEAPLAAGTDYFPGGTFGPLKTDWYSRCLDVMREPSLFRAPATGWIEAYRFLWVRSFDEPVVARIELYVDGSGVLTVKMLSGDSRCKSTESLQRWSVTDVSRQQGTEFLAALAQAGYWNLPTPDARCDLVAGPPSAACVDGARWVLEGVRTDRYHVVDRWSSSGIPYRSAALRLLELAELRIRNVY
jgi:hypothetical protein